MFYNFLSEKRLNPYLFSKNLSYLCTQILHQEWHLCPPTGLLMIVGSGGKAMRVRIIDPLKINDYGNQED